MVGVCTGCKLGLKGRLEQYGTCAQRHHIDMQEDGQAGLQELGGNATLLFYQTPEGNEGRKAYLEKRPPDFSKFPRFP